MRLIPKQSKEARQAFIEQMKCQECQGPITFRSFPKWKEIRQRECCYDCAAKRHLEKNRLLSIANARQEGDRLLDHRGYVQIKVNGRFKLEHVLKAESVLGRKLRKSEVVHHINGVTWDNRNSNLLITTRGEHLLLHQKMAALYKQEHPEFSGPKKVADKLYMTDHFDQPKENQYAYQSS